MPSIDKLLDIKDRAEDIVSRPSAKKKKKRGKAAPPFMSAALKLASMAAKRGNPNAKPVGPIAKYLYSKRQK
tara:strand:+ start:2027 stop:2242 length:216 start_codon:yes stop_codon:yes gene_type:complete